MYRLFAVFYDKDHDQSMLAPYLDFLPQNRREQALRYRHHIDRDNCILAYLLLRHALKVVFGLHDPEIAADEYGKPYLPEHREIHFNISHCAAGCVVGVSDVPIGVDIQNLRPFSPKLMEYCCAPKELEQLARSEHSNAEFARIWAMKESWVKMLGTGIRGRMTAIDTTELEHRIEVLCREDCCIAVSVAEKET